MVRLQVKLGETISYGVVCTGLGRLFAFVRILNCAWRYVSDLEVYINP